MTMALFTAILHACLLLCASAATTTILAQCPTECGGVAIPYPFGIGKGCYRDGFDISCYALADGDTPKPRLNTGNVEVVEILPMDGLLRVNKIMANNCYISPNETMSNRPSIDLALRPYKFSDTRNKFVAIGCDTLAYLIDGTEEMSSSARFSTGCVSICSNISYVQNYTCSGVGCCETRIPRGLRSYNIELLSFWNHTNCLEFSPCSFGFLADTNDFNFTTANFTNLINREYYPVTLEWSIGNQTCNEVGRGDTACLAANSTCYNATPGVGGYRCNCPQGFEGNPYVVEGCIDIDECKVSKTPCVGTGWCNNTIGNYTCICRKGMTGDGRQDGVGCKCLPGMEEDNASGGCKPVAKFPLVVVVLGTGFIILFLIATISWLFWMRKKAKMAEFFLQNGGDILKQRNSATRIYSSAELSKATNNYSTTIGTGTYGTVYRGVLPDRTEVAIKMSKVMGDKHRTEQFINEVVILSSINHNNIVRLLGCCLETEVPMLVYEFVPNGNLFQHIHKEGYEKSLSLEDRVRIATGTAEALAYMHSKARTPIIHRDIKSANILLTEDLTAQVADFGASQVVPSNKKEVVSVVVGTYGYLDPEFIQTETFTDKSDVYSFGMVLVELLTGKKVSSNADGPKENRTLATYFISCMADNRLEEVLDKHILDEKIQLEYIIEIAKLALSCLELNREQRPTMKNVFKKLEDLAPRKVEPINNNDEDTKPSAAKAQDYSTLECGKIAECFNEDSKKSIAEDLREVPKKNIDGGESSIGRAVLPFNIMKRKVSGISTSTLSIN